MNVGAQRNQKIAHPFHQTYQKMIASAVQKKIVPKIDLQPIPHRMIGRKIYKRRQSYDEYAAENAQNARSGLLPFKALNRATENENIPSDKKTDESEFRPK